MPEDSHNHYQTLGLDYDCSAEDVKAAYRFLAKETHPDLNPESAEARRLTQELNEAYETLSSKSRRRDYDLKLRSFAQGNHSTRGGSINQNISQNLHLKIEQLFRGALVDVKVDDPANKDSVETYELNIPAMTPPNTKFRVSRSQNIGGGIVTVRIKVLPDYKFKTRGPDLQCDLKLSTDFARNGGTKHIEGPTGERFEIEVPPNVPRGEVIRIEGEGLANSRGARGDILVRITYRPQVRIQASDAEADDC